MQAADKIQQYYRDHGFAKAVFMVAGKSAKTLLASVLIRRTSYVIERTLEGDVPDVKATTEGAFCRAGIEDLGRFNNVRAPWLRHLKIFEDRFRRGQSCIACYRSGQAVGYIWITDLPETDRNLGLTVRPKADESYGFDLYVMPEYRRHLVGFELVSHWLRHAKEEGKRKAIGVVASYNQPMLMMTKLVFGFRKTKEVRSLEFLSRRGFVISAKDLS